MKVKSEASSVTLLPNVVELLKSVIPLRVEPSIYVFTDGQGGNPIDQSEYACGFQAVLRVLEIRIESVQCARLSVKNSFIYQLLHVDIP